MESFTALVAGVILGYAVSQILLFFFADEIFAFLDRLRKRVRKALGK